ncbi:MAG: hypothetical protein ACK559_11800, partial [bacterium]
PPRVENLRAWHWQHAELVLPASRVADADEVVLGSGRQSAHGKRHAAAQVAPAVVSAEHPPLQTEEAETLDVAVELAQLDAAVPVLVALNGLLVGLAVDIGEAHLPPDRALDAQL